MQIVFLGAGGYHPNSHRHTACVMLPELGVAFDAGTGAFRIPAHLKTDRLDIFLSHAHLDHVFGLTSLIGLFKGDDPAKLVVHGEAEKLEAIQSHLYSPLLFPVEPYFTSQPLEEKPYPLGGDTHLTWFPLPSHPGGSVGYRIDGPDGSLAYVTDTVASHSEAYLEKIRGVDLLIHEAYFDDSQRELAELTGHSCLMDVADLAKQAEVGRLVLVHMNPRADTATPLDLDEARQVFENCEMARDELVVEV